MTDLWYCHGCDRTWVHDRPIGNLHQSANQARTCDAVPEHYVSKAAPSSWDENVIASHITDLVAKFAALKMRQDSISETATRLSDRIGKLEQDVKDGRAETMTRRVTNLENRADSGIAWHRSFSERVDKLEDDAAKRLARLDEIFPKTKTPKKHAYICDDCGLIGWAPHVHKAVDNVTCSGNMKMHEVLPSA